MADFVAYAYGTPSTHWGALRVADGHPAPYVQLEINNPLPSENLLEDADGLLRRPF